MIEEDDDENMFPPFFDIHVTTFCIVVLPPHTITIITITTTTITFCHWFLDCPSLHITAKALYNSK
jgi:hypothetical protein